jgi:hypothetical protein
VLHFFKDSGAIRLGYSFISYLTQLIFCFIDLGEQFFLNYYTISISFYFSVVGTIPKEICFLLLVLSSFFNIFSIK